MKGFWFSLLAVAVVGAGSVSPAWCAVSEKRQAQIDALADVKNAVRRYKEIYLVMKKIRDERSAAKYGEELKEKFDEVEQDGEVTAMGIAMKVDVADDPVVVEEFERRRVQYRAAIKRVKAERDRIESLEIDNEDVAEMIRRFDHAEEERVKHEAFSKQEAEKKKASEKGGKKGKKESERTEEDGDVPARPSRPSGSSTFDLGEMDDVL